MPAVDAATLRDSPVSRRGLRRRGGRETVGTAHSKKAMHLMGAPGDGALDLQFHGDLKADSYVSLVEYALRRHKKAGITADNAGALTGRAMQGYIAGTNGAVEMVHVPPHTPQLNPMETRWREIRAAIADIFFGGPDRMRDTIIGMFHNGEIPTVKLFEWLLPPPQSARRLSAGPGAAARLPTCSALPPHARPPRAGFVGAGRPGRATAPAGAAGGMCMRVADFIAFFMTVTTRYPQAVVLTDGSLIQITEDVWRRRQLVVETDRPEAEVRNAFAVNGLRPTVLEFVKDGQLGSGMVKKFRDWQVHVRFYRSGRHIQIDGKVEVSNSYVEHLGHGWISGFTTCADIVARHFGGYWAYHKGYGKYVSRIINESVLRLTEPRSKTCVVATAVIGTILAVALVWAFKDR